MKKFIVGMLVGCLLSFTTVLHAAGETVQAVVAALKFRVNDVDVTLKNAPIVINGVSYLPVREVAELVGYKVDYDAETATVNLSVYRKDDESSMNKGSLQKQNITETFWKEMNAIIYNGEIYFHLNDFWNKYRDDEDKDVYITYNKNIVTIHYKGVEKTFDGNDESNVLNYNGKVYISAKLFPENAEIRK